MYDVHRPKPYSSKNKLFRRRKKFNLRWKKIKKVLTALLNENINNELKNNKNIKIVSNDLLYQEAVLEYLEENKEIDFLLLNENLPGEKIEDFIEKINKTKIILFTENSRKNENYINTKKVYKIFTNSELSVKKISEILEKDEDNYTEKLEKEIEELKRKINENKKQENKFISKIINLKKNTKKETTNKTSKIISITGNNGQAKALLTIKISKKLKRKKSKTLIIDLDLLNMKIFEILNIKNKEKKSLKIEDHRVNQNKYLSLLSGKNLLFKINEKIHTEEIKKIIEKLKEKYEYIIVNTSLECFFELNKMILEQTDSIYLIIEKNIKELMELKNITKIYWENWKIEKEKFNIILAQKKKMELKILNEIPYNTKKEENGTSTYKYTWK